MCIFFLVYLWAQISVRLTKLCFMLYHFRYADLAWLRWSAICVGIDFSLCHVKYYIDGRKVADEDLVSTWQDLCDGKDPQFPTQVDRMMSGQNMVGDLTNINVYGMMLSDEDMNKVLNISLFSAIFLPNVPLISEFFLKPYNS